ncbi:hypothetical protein BFS06_14580 [Clostridium perfringens]|uniref:Uncharacterized protein n=1 Tax=Clostridium perfringens TaxID=1502 RepID=A0A140GR90_CLOPF|nr:hypothetical protein [Clostridium perfringens]AMN31049.1 hypothetical protein JFP838_pA0133 [Clostridium perfringens]TBX14431.1 hypothetical protein BFS06_14580 [Clostridium perfringens]
MNNKRYVSKITINSKLDIECDEFIDKDLKRKIDEEIKKAIKNVINSNDFDIESSIINIAD